MKIPTEIVGMKASTRNRIANLVRWAHRYTPQALDQVTGLIYEEKANRESELGKINGIQWAKWVTDALKKGAG